MKLYEGLLMLEPGVTPETRNNQNKAIDELVKKHKGKIIRTEFVEKKPLGYSINKRKEAYVRVIDFQMPADSVNEFHKTLELNNEILKFMITVKKAEKESSADKAKKKAETPQPAAS